ncbi:metal-dependent hydrolase [Pseudomonadota bacterium]
MPTPIGHTLFGLTLLKLSPASTKSNSLKSFLLVLIAANAPDLDFIPGILVGDFNRYHQQYSHSLIFAAAFALLFFVLFFYQRQQRLKISLLAGTLYSSHLLLDLITYDGAEPFGIPLLWPFSSQLFHSPYTLFGGILHGQFGDDFITAIQNIVQWSNLKVIAIELVVTLPFLFIAIALANRRKAKIN